MRCYLKGMLLYDVCSLLHILELNGTPYLLHALEITIMGIDKDCQFSQKFSSEQ